MSKKLREKLREGVIVFDVDGVLASYEFGENCHYAPIWEEAFISAENNPYRRVNPLPVFQQFIHTMKKENVYVCSVAAEFEQEGKRDFVLRNYDILEENIIFVESKAQKLQALREIEKKTGEKQIAIVDDTVKTLDHIYDNSNFLTVHVSSFFDN